MRHSFDLSDRAKCERHCLHVVMHADVGDGMAWCCRCGNLAIIPQGLVFEEKTHGCFPPNLLGRIVDPRPKPVGESAFDSVMRDLNRRDAEITEDK